MGGYGSTLYGGKQDGTGFVQPVDWQDSVNTAFRGIITALLGLGTDVMRPANQNAPTGKLTTSKTINVTTDGVTVPVTVTTINQWGTVLLSHINQVGEDIRTQLSVADSDPPTSIEIIQGQRRVTASVQFFRGNALHQANRLKALFKTTSGVMAMQDAGLGLIRVGPVLNVTQFVDSYEEERAQVEIEFYAIAAEVAPLETVNQFPIEFGINSLDDPSNEVIKTP
jgi:hypothetical protein